MQEETFNKWSLISLDIIVCDGNETNLHNIHSLSLFNGTQTYVRVPRYSTLIFVVMLIFFFCRDDNLTKPIFNISQFKVFILHPAYIPIFKLFHNLIDFESVMQKNTKFTLIEEQSHNVYFMKLLIELVLHIFVK